MLYISGQQTDFLLTTHLRNNSTVISIFESDKLALTNIIYYEIYLIDLNWKQ